MTKTKHGAAMAGLMAVATIAATAGAAGETWITHVPGAMTMQLPSMGDPNVAAFLLDVAGSEHADAPITCGFFRLEKSAAALSYDYDYDETKLILDGELTFSDGEKSVTATAGDVVFIPKGAHVDFTTGSSGLAFVCGQRERGGA
jgi:uncharacterized cupin superfamily protein